MVVSLATVKEAEALPKFTAVAPVNPLPEMVTDDPTGPVFGDSDVMMGRMIGVGGIGDGTVGSVPGFLNSLSRATETEWMPLPVNTNL